MITLFLEADKIKKFNLKNFEREQKLYSAWYSMQNDSKYEDKSLKITTDKGEVLQYKIPEILSCEFEECEYIEAVVKEKNKDSVVDFMKKLDESTSLREKQNVEIFLNELKKKRISINSNDPKLLEVLDYVKNDRNGAKISFYVNFYINTLKNAKV